MMALHQLMKINYVRVLSKRNKTSPKYKNLVSTCNLLSFTCEMVQNLLVP